jgi:ATP citrate (pro-S)-lyase
VKLVIKPDQLFGQRGKHGLVKVNTDLSGAFEFISSRMGQEVKVNKTQGKLTHFLIEEFVRHEKEYYLSLNCEREFTEILFSHFGGVEIEDNWDKIRHLEIEVGEVPSDQQLCQLIQNDNDPDAKVLKEFIRSIFLVFEHLDFTLLEMNPFTITQEKKIAILDAVTEVDGTAHFKSSKKWGSLEFPEPFGKDLAPEERFISEMDEKTGASLKLTILNPAGRIWSLVAGGGASVVYADTVADLGFGHELGNYGEYSGAPNEEETYHYAKTVIDLATRNPDGRGRVLMIGGGIANFTDVARTFKGIIHALKEFQERLKKANVKIFVRRAGPNYQTGLKLMKQLSSELGLPIEVFGPEKTMTHIIPLAVDYIKSTSV